MLGSRPGKAEAPDWQGDIMEGALGVGGRIQPWEMDGTECRCCHLHGVVLETS